MIYQKIYECKELVNLLNDIGFINGFVYPHMQSFVYASRNKKYSISIVDISSNFYTTNILIDGEVHFTSNPHKLLDPKSITFTYAEVFTLYEYLRKAFKSEIRENKLNDLI